MGNWALGSLPVLGEHVVWNRGDASLLYSLDAIASVALRSAVASPNFRGQSIGDPAAGEKLMLTVNNTDASNEPFVEFDIPYARKGCALRLTTPDLRLLRTFDTSQAFELHTGSAADIWSVGPGVLGTVAALAGAAVKKLRQLSGTRASVLLHNGSALVLVEADTGRTVLKSAMAVEGEIHVGPGAVVTLEGGTAGSEYVRRLHSRGELFLNQLGDIGTLGTDPDVDGLQIRAGTTSWEFSPATNDAGIGVRYSTVEAGARYVLGSGVRVNHTNPTKYKGGSALGTTGRSGPTDPTA